MISSIDAIQNVGGPRELTITPQRAKNQQLLASVSDIGLGLPTKQTDDIFDAFFTTKPRGTDMRLPISCAIIEAYGECLSANNNSPRGATFHIILPSKVQALE